MITLSKLFPLGFLAMGIFLLMQVILPIISFQVWYFAQKSNSSLLINPKSSQGSQILGVSIKQTNNFPAFVSSLKRETPALYQQFSLTIPKIKLDQAKVLVDSNDLSKSLAHLPGSALPGEKGNVFISGHSALSPLFSLKAAVFDNLPNLKKDDEIILEAQGTKFTYQISDVKVVDPSDLSVINPPESQGRYVSLMTCVPPGLNFKRLIILGKMI